MTDLTSLTLAEARDGLARKTFTSVELTDAHFAAMERARALNAYVLETPDHARKMAAASDSKLAKGEGMGVACVSSQERKTASWTACVAHVAVAPSGEVKVKKLTVATDVGTAVNPDGIRAQVEGGAMWGLSLALYEKATMKDGGIEQSNFDTYTPLRMSQMPEVAVNIIANGEPATGVGEPTVTVVAPAIANAIFNAVGARVRSLPITADAIKAAMRA